MFRTSLMFGLIAGIIVIIPMLLGAMFNPEGMIAGGHLLGYLSMLVALSVIFVGVKRYRDRAQGGVIKFVRAFLIGLGISAFAGIIYVIGWEITLALTNYQFMEVYSQTMIEAERAKGVSGPDLDAFVAQMQSMTEQYRNPAFRAPITFLEIFPVGLIAAALLRNPRFLPARGTPMAG